MSPDIRPGRRSTVVIAVTGAVILLLAWASRTAERDTAGRKEQARSEAAAPSSHPETRSGHPDQQALGRPDAPVVMVEYADYRCGYCGRFTRTTEPELIERYVDQGILRIEWRHFPVLGEESERAARAAWAAGRQGRFQEFHTLAYDPGATARAGGFTEKGLTALARRAGVADLERFTRDLRGRGAAAAVRADRKEAEQAGMNSTPSFLINGVPVIGAQPTEVFVEEIEDAYADTAER
ncbi:thioredoxin domain-containing protein [Streptomyces sp. NPDC000594]|uniref:DsbA family protein n=1 Tax=Streptomyces sp. NPDC000594 TaxID=3154261 RepID=UPI00333018D2